MSVQRGFAVLFVFIFLGACVPVFAQGEDFADAVAAYEKGRFREAAEMWEALSESRPTVAVFFNAGNARFRAGQKGKALLHYLRALGRAPRDKDALWNCRVVRSVLEDRLSVPASSVIREGVRSVTDRIALHEAAYGFTAGLLLLALFAASALFFPQGGALRKAGVTLIWAWLALCSTVFYLKWRDAEDPTAVVLEKEIRVRYGPSENETAAFLLHEGASAKVLDRSRGWFYIHLSDGKAGWIPESACELV